MKLKSVLIIGSGKRVQSCVLPAVLSIPNRLKLAGIYGRSKKIITLPGIHKRIVTRTTLRTIGFRAIDIIIISVTVDNVPDVLQQLGQHSVSHITLLIDTPVLRFRHLGFVTYFSLFKNVFVAEDYIGMAHFTFVKELIQTGLIGQLRHIYLFHSGYQYHALATLKNMVQSSYVLSLVRKKISCTVSEIQARFSGGVTATILEPRDYNIGKFLIVGTHGMIADYPLKGAIYIRYLFRKGIYKGFKISGYGYPKHEVHNEAYWDIVKHLPDAPLVSSQKIEAMITLLEGILEERAECRYFYWQGLYDRYASAFVGKYGYFIDLQLPFMKKSLFQYCIDISSFILSFATTHR